MIEELRIDFIEAKEKIGDEDLGSVIRFLGCVRNGREDLPCISRRNQSIYKAWITWMYGLPHIWNSTIIFHSFVCSFRK